MPDISWLFSDWRSEFILFSHIGILSILNSFLDVPEFIWHYPKLSDNCQNQFHIVWTYLALAETISYYLIDPVLRILWKVGIVLLF